MMLYSFLIATRFSDVLTGLASAKWLLVLAPECADQDRGGDGEEPAFLG